MPRDSRLLLDGAHYHLIARGNNHLHVFAIEGAFEAFRNLLFLSKQKFVWKLSHYCLMINHFHLLGQMEKGEDLPKLMHFLLLEYSRWYRKKNRYEGYLWQGRYKSLLIQKDSYYLECGRYIERNPVRAGIAEKAEDYPWSSYQHYAFGKKDILVEDDPFYEGLGKDIMMRQEIYRDYTKLDGPYDVMVDEKLVETFF